MIKTLIKFGIPLVIFFFLFKSLIGDWNTTLNSIQTVNASVLMLSVIAMIFVYPFGAFVWYLILKKFKFSVEIRSTILVWLIANTSRYIPGSIWQYVGRLQLAKKNLNLSYSQTGTSLFFEFYLNILAALLIASLSVSGLILISIPFVIFFIHPKIINKTLRLSEFIIKKKFRNFEVPRTIPLLYTPFIFFCLTFVWNGFILFLLTSSFGYVLPVHAIFLMTSFSAISWFVGYISLFAPGGIGVTDGMVALLLTSLVPFPIASAVAILLRFFMTLTELIVFGFAILKHKKII